jgi:hypothetical protein
MKLIDAYNLLAEDGTDNARSFSEVYKLYGFADEDELRRYMEFVLHETVDWFVGFPARLKSRQAFAKPKTAIIKLLKQSAVQTALGTEYTSKAHQKIWDTFKQNVDKILSHRNPTDIDAQSVGSVDSEASAVTAATAATAASLGTVETVELQPVPPISRNPTSWFQPQDDRVEFLKTLLLKMPVPAEYADVFRLLVSRV